jgi:cytidylate kinase
LVSHVPVIAIDGPSGSGKGTIARDLASRLGWWRLDSGALYRAVGLAAERKSVDFTDDQALEQLTENLDLAFRIAGGTEMVQMDGMDVTHDIRSETAGRAASQIAASPRVRAALLTRQREFARPPGLIADGRDMGTVVFPDATLKVFLTASAEERARRRHKQLKEKGIDVSLRDLSKGIAERDERDASRSVAPLRPADDARVLDSTDLSPAEVVEQVLAWLRDEGIAVPEK